MRRVLVEFANPSCILSETKKREREREREGEEMGGKCPHRKVKTRRLAHKQNRRSKFLVKGDDMVYEELLKQAELLKKSEMAEANPLPLDPDLPGMGQFYCLHCDRHFYSDDVRQEHYKSKLHKKKVKKMNGPAPHTQVDADMAAGMGRPDNGPKLMSM
ncbi:zinc finger (C2H2 type) family protein isoform X1 [Carex rostrata]